MNIQTDIINSLETIHSDEWNNLLDGSNPFLDYHYLAGLEKHHCLDNHGWYPSHVIAEQDGKLVGALPLYIKTNSLGEFVFDWSWAEAYERAGGQYYPKLVAAIPFTPVAGPRFLVSNSVNNKQEIVDAMFNRVIKFAESSGFSGLHVLFTDSADRENLQQRGMMLRSGCQYQWFNNNYISFEHFLARLTAKKRKQIRREREFINKADLIIEVISGEDIMPEIWSEYHQFYQSTFYQKWGEPRLTLEFFQSLSVTMPATPVLFMAKQDNKYIAGAFAMRGRNTLFGRHWGCHRKIPCLHFELCYYQTIEYCIQHKLEKLDAGVQGEHKMNRGFVPVRSWSAHWIADRNLAMAIENFLGHEHRAVETYIAELQKHLAYRSTDK